MQAIPAPSFDNQALRSAAENRDFAVKQQTIGELTFNAAQSAEGLTISTVSMPNRRGISFRCAAKSPSEVADVLLMGLSLQTSSPPPALADDEPAAPLQNKQS